MNCTGKLYVMAKQVRPRLTKPDTNYELEFVPLMRASTGKFHQDHRKKFPEGRIYGCNLHLLLATEGLLGKPGGVHICS